MLEYQARLMFFLACQTELQQLSMDAIAETFQLVISNLVLLNGPQREIPQIFLTAK